MFLSKIKKRDGRIVDFDPRRIKNAIHKAFLAVELGDGEKAEAVTDEVVRLLREKFAEQQVPSVEDIQDLVIEVLRQKGYQEVAQNYQDYRKKKEEIRALRETLGIVPKLTINAAEVLKARYLLRDEKENIVETPARLFERVAKAMAKVDEKFGGNSAESEKIFYEIMTKLEFLPNTPTLFNAGTSIGQLAACFVLPVDDSLESIFSSLKNMAMIEQTGGGVGFDFSRLRPRGDIVGSTKGVASGPVSFMRVFDTATEVIKAGGKRRGAMMAILRVDHPDIIEFITAKRNPQFLSNFNVSVAVTEDFLQVLEEDQEYWLINPRNKEKVKQLRAREIWDLIAESAWASGDPGVVFIDEINRYNPTPQVGRIESTNPCVPSSTWVMTEDGPRQVRELLGNPFVAMVNGKLWNGSPTGFFSTGIKPLCRLTTKEGFEISLTKNHPVMKVKGLTRYEVSTEWAQAGSLKPQDKVVVSNHRGIGGWKGKYTEAEGYLVGLLLGDGTVKKDKAVLSSWGEDDGAKAVRTRAYSYAKDMPHRSDFRGWTKVKDRDEYRLATGHLKAVAEELGLKPGAKAITEGIERASSDFCRGLLRGFFDADGSVQGTHSKGVSIRLSQSDLQTLQAVQRLLLRLGIFSKTYVNRRSEGKKPMPDGKGGTKVYMHKPQHELIISNDNILVFQQNIGFGDSDKTTKLGKAVNSYRRRLNRERFVATVASIEECGEEEVYDASVLRVNAFDANGFYIHNCGEQPLLPYESCNLGSINLSKMVRDGALDWEKLRETVRNAVHFLDNVVDANVYPIKEIADITHANRKIGLGVMGFADMLIMLGIPYDSEEALKLGEQVMAFIEEKAHEKSVEIAQKRGSFPNFKGSRWDGKYSAFRNATVTTVAPTGTISIIAGCSSGIEPLFAVSFMRNVLGGARLFETNSLFEEIAKQRSFYSAKLLEEVARSGSVQKIDGIPDDVKRLFVTALDIDPVWHIKMQAVFQKSTDNAVSKTVNLPHQATVENVREIYRTSMEAEVQRGYCF